jgi:hypothetical protein
MKITYFMISAGNWKAQETGKRRKLESARNWKAQKALKGGIGSVF